MSETANVSSDELERARASLRRETWTRSGIAGNMADRIIALGLPIGPLNDTLGAALPSSESLTSETLSHLIEHVLPGIDSGLRDLLCLAATKGRAVSSIDPATAILFVRALTPLAGLRTYPEAVLFETKDVKLVRDIKAEPLPPASRPAPAAVTGIVKITRACNLRCTYCHDWRSGPNTGMRPEIQARAMHWLTAGTGATKVHVLLHGGEPTIIGVKGIVRLLAFQAMFASPGQNVRTSIQTNATLLTPSLLDLLVRFDISVSVSLDGPPAVHDRTRRDIRGLGSSDRVRAGMAILRENGLLAGVVVVVTPALIAAGATALVEYLAECGVESAALIAQRPAYGEAIDEASTLPVDIYCAFLLAVETVRRRVVPSLDIRELDAADKAMRGLPPRTCELQGSCVGQYFTIEPDGAVSHCDKFVGDPLASLGTVSDPFEAVARGAAAERLRARGAATLDRLGNCPWRQHCRGWCPHERDIAARSPATGDCCGLAPLFDGLHAMQEMA